MVKQVFKTTRSRSMDSHSSHYEAGHYVFNEGDLGTEMFVIQEGEIEIVKVIRDDEKCLAVLSHGDFFGEMSILEDLPRTASARALTDCKLLRINGSTFDQMLRKNPEIAVRMMRKLSRRLRETDSLLREALGGGEDEVQALEVPAAESAVEVIYGPERLVHNVSGIAFHLAAGAETTIGRRDPVTGIMPDIDLSPVDTQRSISRRHAKIFRRDGKLYVREEIGTMNGTFVNSERVETGIPAEFTENDEVRFGLVTTFFHLS